MLLYRIMHCNSKEPGQNYRCRKENQLSRHFSVNLSALFCQIELSLLYPLSATKSNMPPVIPGAASRLLRMRPPAAAYFTAPRSRLFTVLPQPHFLRRPAAVYFRLSRSRIFCCAPAPAYFTALPQPRICRVIIIIIHMRT